MRGSRRDGSLWRTGAVALALSVGSCANDGNTGSSGTAGAHDASRADETAPACAADDDCAARESGMADAAPTESGAADTGMPGGNNGVPIYHRVDNAECMAPRTAGTCPGANPGDASSYLCSSDGDCADGGVDGRCERDRFGCFCSYDACRADTDCASGQLCVCHDSPYWSGGPNTCMPGNCRVDPDCGAGGRCSPSPGACAEVVGYYCHTPNDECTNDSDCVGFSQYCSWSTADRRWECGQEGPCS